MATAGSLTHKESGYIAELLTLQALELGKNVVVDGSLRDAEWHATYFEKLRESYSGATTHSTIDSQLLPHFTRHTPHATRHTPHSIDIRIAILHVTASPEEVLKRAARRAATTKRVIPRGTLLSTIDQVPHAVRTLTPLAEVSCRATSTTQFDHRPMTHDPRTTTHDPHSTIHDL